MAKKRASNQPIVAEEPARPEEQFQLDQSSVAPPSSRPVGPRTNVTGSSGPKAYGARSARERRASSTRRATTPARREHRAASGIKPEIVANMLEHPTIVVTEDQLRKQYSYVVSDLRSMALVAAGLIIALAILAEVLPK